MRIATIENNVVTNIILGDQSFVDSLTGVFVIVDEITCNIGDYWNGVSFAPPAPPPEAPPPVWEHYIDIGPFFDRFGVAKMQVLLSTDPMVQAILRDVQVRKWVDLTREDVATALAYISSIIPALTPEIIANVIHLPVEDAENMALRKQYF